MYSSAQDIAQAAFISSRVASGFPHRRFDAIVPENSVPF